MKVKIRKYFVFILIVISIALMTCFVSHSESSVEQTYLNENIISDSARGKVIAISKEERILDEHSFSRIIQDIEVEIISGKHKEKTIDVQNIIDERMTYNVKVNAGDKVLLYLEEDSDGNILSAYIDEVLRDTYLLYLVIIFILSLSIIGGLKGIKAIITLGLTVFAVIKIFFPLILSGYSPVIVSALLCTGIITTTLLIIGGLNKKSVSAIIGTAWGVLLAGMLALIFGHAARLTGLANQEAQMLMFISEEIDFNFQGILFASIIIGSLGAIMDVGMSVASAVNEVRWANPEIKTGHLIKAGMNVGRDIMGTMANTLILAYAGGAIHLILLFMAYEVPILEIINQDLIASEIVRALAGSVGLVFSVPFTALTAGLIYRKQPMESIIEK